MIKTITVSDQTFTLGEVGAATARDIQNKSLGATDFSIAWIVASLRAGGDADATEQSVGDLPYKRIFQPLALEVLQFNGLVEATPGEAEAAPETAAASTSDQSTQQ